METNRLNIGGAVKFDRFLTDTLEKLSQGWLDEKAVQAVAGGGATAATIDKHTVVVDCTGAGAKTITIPDANTCPGKWYLVIATTGTVLLQDTSLNAVVANVLTLGATFVFSNGAAGAAGWTVLPLKTS